MSNKTALDGYKSPLKKLVKFFETSRDKWKARSHEKQKRIDFLETKIKDLENSRENWKQKAKTFEKQLKETSQPVSFSNSENNSENNDGISPETSTGNIARLKPLNTPVLSTSSTREMLPRNEVVKSDLVPKRQEILPPSNGSTILMPDGLLPRSTAASHSYPLVIQQLSIQMLLDAHTSLRGTMKCLTLLAQFIPMNVPSWVTIQNWLLRFGLYQLQNKLPNRTDWIWIIDATIQSNTKKCFLVAGITQAHLSKCGFNLHHQDVVVLKMEVVSKLNGEIVHQHLEELSQQTGIPAQIISDHGSDIMAGINRFCDSHRKPTYSYDITHKTALLLEAMLKPCSTWHKFSNQCSLTRQKLLQTDMAFLVPPRQHLKSRYMNLDDLINWAQNIIDYQANEDYHLISKDYCIDQLVLEQLLIAGYDYKSKSLKPLLGKTYPSQQTFLKALNTLDPTITPDVQTIILKFADVGFQKFSNHFDWINDFKNVIEDYRQLMIVIKIANKQIKKNGLNRQSSVDFKQQIKNSQISSEIATVLAQDINDFLKSEGSLLKKPIIRSPSQTGLGSSDVIESIFGKFKTFLKGFTEIGKLVLTIPAFLGKITPDNLKQALESVHQQDVEDWLEDSIGQSTLSKRREAFPKNGTKLG